jgi:ferredoxin-NADP reductase
MNEITTPTHKPAFIMGPFLSPFSSPAMDSENLVAVASGIGVTPAISLIKQYSCTSRRMNLIWICRDAALVEHFLQSLTFGADGHILIYYTGKRPLYLNEDLPPNTYIFKGRPDLEKTISELSSTALPTTTGYLRICAIVTRLSLRLHQSNE